MPASARNAPASASDRQLLAIGGKLAHHQPLDVRPRGFVVLAAGAVVADLRIGEDDDLPGIGRIGEHFLVAGERGIEDHFAGPLGGRTKTPALEDRAVFQGQDCRIQCRFFLPEWINLILAGVRSGHRAAASVRLIFA